MPFIISIIYSFVKGFHSSYLKFEFIFFPTSKSSFAEVITIIFIFFVSSISLHRKFFICSFSFVLINCPKLSKMIRNDLLLCVYFLNSSMKSCSSGSFSQMIYICLKIFLRISLIDLKPSTSTRIAPSLKLLFLSLSAAYLTALTTGSILTLFLPKIWRILWLFSSKNLIIEIFSFCLKLKSNWLSSGKKIRLKSVFI